MRVTSTRTRGTARARCAMFKAWSMRGNLSTTCAMGKGFLKERTGQKIFVGEWRYDAKEEIIGSAKAAADGSTSGKSKTATGAVAGGGGGGGAGGAGGKAAAATAVTTTSKGSGGGDGKAGHGDAYAWAAKVPWMRGGVDGRLTNLK